MSSGLSLSFELIYLMGWLLKNNKAKLKQLVLEAIQAGIMEEVAAMHDVDYLLLSDQMQGTVEQFMEYFEQAINEGMLGSEASLGAPYNLAPVFKKFDPRLFDQRTLLLSLQEAKKKISYKKKTDPSVSDIDDNSILFERILKNLNHSKKDLMH
jgi:hypothetical protein